MISFLSDHTLRLFPRYACPKWRPRKWCQHCEPISVRIVGMEDVGICDFYDTGDALTARCWCGEPLKRWQEPFD